MTWIFKVPGVRNVVIYFEKGSKKYNDNTDRWDEFYNLPQTSEGIRMARERCANACLIVVNDLSGFQIKVVNQLQKHQKIAWRFFGHELYGKMLPDVLGPLTIGYSKPTKNKSLKQLLAALKDGIVGSPFKRAMQKTHLFLGIIPEEYDYLKTKGWKLPPFLKLPIQPQLPQQTPNKLPLVVVGNSRNIFNNHLEILELLSDAPKSNFEIKLFFNYGVNGRYADAVRLAAEQIGGSVAIIDEFLDAATYEGVYKNAAAFIHNGYRQMALNNILTALKYGVKVYLSERNPVFGWLNDLGFAVFSIEKQLRSDWKSSNLYLSPAMQQQNVSALHRMKTDYTIDMFMSELVKHL